MHKKKISLRNGLLAIIVVCWLVPILIIMSLAGVLLSKSYEQSAQQELDDSARYALRQIQFRLQEAVDDSKSVSYDGTVYGAYRRYLDFSDAAALYRSVNDYLVQNFSRTPQYRAVFVSFWDPTVDVDVYLLNSGVTSHSLLQQCRRDNNLILEQMGDADTQIRFFLMDGNLYLARNLLDNRFNSYATLTILLEPQVLFQSFVGLKRVNDMEFTVDNVKFCVSRETLELISSPLTAPANVRYDADLDGHSLCFSATLTPYKLRTEAPWLIQLIAAVALLVLPLGIAVISMFHRHVTQPAEILAKANQLVQAGERGYEITQTPPNAEFQKLYEHFNDMSAELKEQFEQSYLEQQASQRAQIKALQSQINPHFLNNTLEIINWEARLADNERVCAMIEALSTMLGAALDRKGRTQIPLEEELGYVDAYLYIIRERLGEGLHVYKKIDPEALPLLIPRLVLQPIVENAVDHDIAQHHGGDLWVRAYQRNRKVFLEVEHDGTLTQEDQEKIQQLLSSDTGTRVGIQNVSRRLRLIYGQQGKLEIIQTEKETILARISFPVQSANQFAERNEP